MFIRLSICLSSLFLSLQCLALSSQTADHYYGMPAEELLLTDDLKAELHQILSSSHITAEGKFDKIKRSCDSSQSQCFSHRRLSYREAREYLFGQLHLEQSSSGQFSVRTTYCNEVVTNDQLPSDQLGPFKIPSPNILNTEHSWPQSLFTTKFPKSYQKSDLHALFPVRSRVNSTRGNRSFGKVLEETTGTCSQAKFGKNKKNTTVFEPSFVSKGNVARAIFYFSSRYNIRVDPIQESILRLWHELDPVDFEEIKRHEAIFEIQNVRNPFIDHPEWVNEIADF